MPVLKPAELVLERVESIWLYHEKVQRDNKLPALPKAELDMSGGIDSAVMAALLVRALGPENVILFHSRINTHESQTARAVALAKGLGVPLVDGHLTGVFNALVAELNRAAVEAGYSQEEIDARCAADPTIMGGIRSCLRAPAGRGINRMLGGGIRHGTGNECEDRFLRFYQKGGDGEVDTNPMAMLSKTEVYQLAVQLSKEMPDCAVPMRACIETAPSPDLWDDAEDGEPDNRRGHTDEAELLSWLGVPFTYGRVDAMTGKILSIGTIERVARFLDTSKVEVQGRSIERVVRMEEAVFDHKDQQDTMKLATDFAMVSPFLKCPEMSTKDDVMKFLRAARRAERNTFHKANPSIPMLGNRESLVEQGILTNDLNI